MQGERRFETVRACRDDRSPSISVAMTCSRTPTLWFRTLGGVLASPATLYRYLPAVRTAHGPQRRLVRTKSFARRFAVNGINGFGGGEIRCRSTTQPAATTPIQNVHLTQTAVIRRRLSLVKVSILGSCCSDIDSRVHLAAGRVTTALRPPTADLPRAKVPP
jgi:hypothetical protein